MHAEIVVRAQFVKACDEFAARMWQPVAEKFQQAALGFGETHDLQILQSAMSDARLVSFRLFRFFRGPSAMNPALFHFIV